MNPTSKPFTVLCLFFPLFLLFSNGCATHSNSVVIGSTHNLPHGMKEIDDAFWWRYKFKIDWKDTNPEWAVDLLLAHAVVSPVLALHADDIPYWRFHRRAVRDDAGHQFSFIFYSTSEVASSVFADINKSESLKDIIKANLVIKVLVGDTKNPQHPNIDDTSDPSWSPELQTYWPSFIMGVSALWLGLIIEDMKHSPQTYDDINIFLDEYRQANTNVTKKWKKEGQHALLHHLSAIFGYQPMQIKKQLIF